VAGIQKLIMESVIKPEETVVGILTGNLMKDPAATVDYHTGNWPDAQFANGPVQIEASLDAVRNMLEQRL
jgi:threonine synthase